MKPYNEVAYRYLIIPFYLNILELKIDKILSNFLLFSRACLSFVKYYKAFYP